MNTLAATMRASATGMTAERFRMDVIASNLANANSVGVNGSPYQRRSVILSGGDDGVKIVGMQRDARPPRAEYDPQNPYADSEGFVYYSNVEPIQEMVDMMGASRAYEANIAAFNSARKMMGAAMQIGKV